MAFLTPTEGPARGQAGTGMVEAILAVPVLLLSAAAVLQLFLIACARIQLSHAAFYAARVASVRGAGAAEEMGASVRGILRTGFAPLSPLGSDIGIEVLPDTERETGGPAPVSGSEGLGMVRVRVRWDYPLLLPLAGPLLSSAPGDLALPGLPTVRLTSVWSMPLQTSAGKEAEGD